MQTELGVICEPQIYKAQIIESYLLPEKRRVLFCLFVLFILERGREGERKEEKYQCAVASGVPPTGNLAHNPAMCPDWELNQRPFGSQSGA